MIAWLPLSIAAGLVSALIVAGSGQSLTLALVISPFAQLPLFLTGLGLGLIPVLVAGLGGAIVCAVLGSPYLGVVFLFMHAVPVVLITRHALLSRTTEAGSVEWYPPAPVKKPAVATTCPRPLQLSRFESTSRSFRNSASGFRMGDSA